jgi:uncharacterized membrane protein
MGKLKKKHIYLILFSAFFSYILVFTTLSILRYRVYRTGALDLGLYSQCIWSVLKGKLLWTSIVWRGSNFASHISPILILLAPFYLLWNNPQMILIIQTVVLASGMWPVYWLAKERFKSEPWGICLAGSYLFYPGLQYANLFDFHPVALAAPFLLFAFLYFSRQKYKIFWIFTLLAMMCKENICLITLSFGLYLVLSNWRGKKGEKEKKERKIGIALFSLSLIWLVVSFKFVFPYFWARCDCIYAELRDTYLSRYEYLGSSYVQIVKTIFSRPFFVLKNLFTFAKIKHFVAIFMPLAFLPLFSWRANVLIFLIFLMNFLSNVPTMYAVGFSHRISPFIPCLFWGMVEGAFLLSRRYRSKSLPFLLLGTTVLTSVLYGPAPYSFRFKKERFRVTARHRRIDKIIKKIPAEASVSASNCFGAHLAHREIIYIFPYRWEGVDYILVDLLKTKEKGRKIIEELLYEEKYEIWESGDNLLGLKKKTWQ